MYEFIMHIICIMICTWQYLCKTMSNLWIDFSKQYPKIRGDSMVMGRFPPPPTPPPPMLSGYCAGEVAKWFCLLRGGILVST